MGKDAQNQGQKTSSNPVLSRFYKEVRNEHTITTYRNAKKTKTKRNKTKNNPNNKYLLVLPVESQPSFKSIIILKSSFFKT